MQLWPLLLLALGGRTTECFLPKQSLTLHFRCARMHVTDACRQQRSHYQRVILGQSKDDVADKKDDFFEGYEEFVAKLDFDKGGWGDEGNTFTRGAPQRKEGRSRQRRLDRDAHDYTRNTEDDRSTNVVDESLVNSLIAERLRSRKRGDFNRADQIREDLLREHGVAIWDQERIWTTQLTRKMGKHDQRRDFSRRDGGADNSRRPLKSRKVAWDFGTKGHDYERAGQIDPSRCTLSDEEIDSLVAKRLRCKLTRNFDEADSILSRLRDEGVFVHDGFKQWRADGEDWGKTGRKENSFAAKTVSSPANYKRRGGGNALSNDDVATIDELVALRSEAKFTRKFQKADDIREDLLRRFDVKILDRTKEWFVGTAEYAPSQRSMPLPEDRENLQSMIEKKLFVRSLAKEKRDYETADAIRDELKNLYSVSIDDRLREWRYDPSLSSDSEKTVYQDLNRNSFVSADGNDPTSVQQHSEGITQVQNDLKDSAAPLQDEKEELSQQVVNGSYDSEKLNSLATLTLKEMLRKAGLPVGGRKAELVERLLNIEEP